MKKRPIQWLILLLICCLSFSSCKKREEDPNEVLNFLKNLKKYTADVTIEIKNDKQNTVYEGKQMYSEGLGYRLELNQGRIFIYKGEKIKVTDLNNENKYNTAKDFDGLFRLSFVKEYSKLLYTNEQIPITFEEREGKKYALMTLNLPGNNRNIEKAAFYMDLSVKLPEKIIIYNQKSKSSAEIKYKNFNTDGEMESSWFE